MATNDDLKINDENFEDALPAVWPGLGVPLVEDLPDPVPLEQLRDQKQIQIISRMVSEIIRCSVVRDALEMIYRLRLVRTLKVGDQAVYRTYDRLINLLRFVSLYAQHPRQIKGRLSEGLVAALFAEIDVKDGLEFYFKYERQEGIDKEQRMAFTYALENNQERIGQQPLVLGDDSKKVSPAVQNWLKAYNLSQPVYTERSKFNQINFLNSERQVRTLSIKEKKVLEEVLEIYDWLLYPPPEIAVIEEQKIGEYMNQLNVKLPKDFKLSDLPKVAAQEPKAALKFVPIPPAGDIKQPFSPSSPTLPTPPSLTLPTKGEGMKVGNESSFAKASADKSEDRQKPRPVAPVSARPITTPSATASIPPILGRDELVPQNQIAKDDWYGVRQAKGLKFGGGEAVKPFVKPPSIPKPAVNIDQKLEELKRKAEKNKKQG